MSRSSLLILLVLSIGLMGGSTCRFSTSDKSGVSSGEGVQAVVDTRTSSQQSSGTFAGSGAGPVHAEVVQTALSTSVETLVARGSTPPADGGGSAAGLPSMAGAEAPIAVSPSLAKGPTGAIPEPGAALLFASGALLLAARLRCRRRA